MKRSNKFTQNKAWVIQIGGGHYADGVRLISSRTGLDEARIRGAVRDGFAAVHAKTLGNIARDKRAKTPDTLVNFAPDLKESEDGPRHAA